MTETPVSYDVETDTDIRHLLESNEADWTDEFNLRLDLHRALGKLDTYSFLLLWEIGACQTPISDLAAMLGITRQAMTKQLERIKAKLRKEMECDSS